MGHELEVIIALQEKVGEGFSVPLPVKMERRKTFLRDSERLGYQQDVNIPQSKMSEPRYSKMCVRENIANHFVKNCSVNLEKQNQTCGMSSRVWSRTTHHFT